jgi:hypothetical protein
MNKRIFFLAFLLSLLVTTGFAQSANKFKLHQADVYAGIEVGSKGVKMSVLEVGKNAKKNGSFIILKDTSINTDFISFSTSTFQATIEGLHKLYSNAVNTYEVSKDKIFTVVSSGVKVQAEKENKQEWIKTLADSFRVRIKEPLRSMEVVDVKDEARLSHLGIVPASRRYTTFLIDIGSGNTKGGYFPNGNIRDFKLFNLTWGTKSTFNEADKRCGDDKTLFNFNKQLKRVIAGAVDAETTYAINVSGAYAMSDYVAVSGGIAWSVATLLYPEMAKTTVVPVTYDDVLKFTEQLYKTPQLYTADNILKTVDKWSKERPMISEEINRVHKVFDQKSLLAGANLLLKIMRQFSGVYEKKQFFLVKNGQVGWISAYVDLHSKD